MPSTPPVEAREAELPTAERVGLHRIARKKADRENGRRVVYDPVEAKDEGVIRAEMTFEHGCEATVFADHLRAMVRCLRTIEEEINGGKRARTPYYIAELEMWGSKITYALWDGVCRHPELAVFAGSPEANEMLVTPKDRIAALEAEVARLRELNAALVWPDGGSQFNKIDPEMM